MTIPVKELSEMMDEIHGGNEWRKQIAFQARITMAKNNIAYLQRFKRLTKNGLASLKAKVKWWDLINRFKVWFYHRGFYMDMCPRVDKLCADWERVIKFPNNLVFNEAKKEQAKFEQDYKNALRILRTMNDLDSMEG